MLLCTDRAQATTLSSAAASLAVNSWVKITPTVSGMTDVFGVSEVGYISEYADSGTWDPVNEKFRFCGSHHGNTYESKCVEYTDSDNTFREIAWAPGACKQLAGCGGTPFNHAYDHNTVDPATGDFYFVHYGQNHIRRYRSGVWDTLTPAVPTSASPGCCRAMKWFPALNGLIFVDADWGVWKGIPGSGTSMAWTRIADTSVNETGLVNLTGLSPTSVTAEYSVVKQVMIVASGTTMYKLDAAGNFTTMVSSPVNLGINTSSLSVDPVSGNFLVMTNGSSTMREFNPNGTGSWSTISTPIPSAISALNGPGDGNVETSITTYGVVMYVKYTNSGTVVYLYRHGASTSILPPVDTQAPTTPTSLISTVVSSSQINLSWAAATDNVGVTGYRVERCQASGCFNFSQIATPAGTTLTNTGLSASTSYSYRVRATDAAGNMSAYSTVVSATTQGGVTPPPPTGGDFAQRCAAVGVLRCFGFDIDSDLNFGIGGKMGAWGSNYGYIPPYGSSDYSRITRDTAQMASGASSLRFTIPSNVGSDVAGAWFANFTPNLSYQVSEGQEVYIQWRQRFSTELLATQYLSNGFKLADASGGDLPACSPGSANSTNCPTSCWDGDVVVQQQGQTGIPITYANCAGPYPYHPLYGYTSSVTIQNAVGCLYPTYASPPCVKMVANEWMTFQLHIKVGKWNTWSSTVQLWIAREGQPSVLVIDCSPTATQKCSNSLDNQASNGWYLYNSNPTYKIGKIWLVPYQTNKNPSQVTPTAYTWYDELIISTSRIPDPGSATGVAQPPVAPTSLKLQ